MLHSSLEVLYGIIDGVRLKEHQVTGLDQGQCVLEGFFPTDKVVDLFDSFP